MFFLFYFLFVGYECCEYIYDNGNYLYYKNDCEEFEIIDKQLYSCEYGRKNMKWYYKKCVDKNNCNLFKHDYADDYIISCMEFNENCISGKNLLIDGYGNVNENYNSYKFSCENNKPKLIAYVDCIKEVGSFNWDDTRPVSSGRKVGDYYKCKNVKNGNENENKDLNGFTTFDNDKNINSTSEVNNINSTVSKVDNNNEENNSFLLHININLFLILHFFLNN